MNNNCKPPKRKTLIILGIVEIIIEIPNESKINTVEIKQYTGDSDSLKELIETIKLVVDDTFVLFQLSLVVVDDDLENY